MIMKLLRNYFKVISEALKRIVELDDKEKEKEKENEQQENIIDENLTPLFDKKYLQPNYNEKYEKKEYLLTKYELRFYKILKSITDELNLIICPQVVLYNIIRNYQEQDFNKIRSKSIDFVITEQNLKIKLCIELDDYSHLREDRKIRDKFINKLFEDTKIKLLRIPIQDFYNLDEIRNKIKECL